MCVYLPLLLQYRTRQTTLRTAFLPHIEYLLTLCSKPRLRVPGEPFPSRYSWQRGDDAKEQSAWACTPLPRSVNIAVLVGACFLTQARTLRLKGEHAWRSRWERVLSERQEIVEPMVQVNYMVCRYCIFDAIHDSLSCRNGTATDFR